MLPGAEAWQDAPGVRASPDYGFVGHLVGLALLASIAGACGPKPLPPTGSETETEDGAETETGSDEPASICEAFTFGEPFWGDYFGDCWGASEQGCPEAKPQSGSGSCHAVYARRLECLDDGTTCRMSEPQFLACQDLNECLEYSAPIVCTRHDAGYIRVHELLDL